MVPGTSTKDADLECRRLVKRFGDFAAVDDVSFTAHEGTLTVLLGPSGCGKSTFMKILGNDLEPSAGNVSKDPNERIGKLKQDQFAYEEFNVIDTVIMPKEKPVKS